MNARTSSAASHKRRLNVAIRDGISDAADTVAFSCECDADDCFDVIWLQAADYDSRRDDPQWAVLARGHRRATVREAA